jgi:hypothetical protein
MIKAETIDIINCCDRVVDVHLKADGFHITSRIPGQAMTALGLQMHDRIFAIFKVTSADYS